MKKYEIANSGCVSNEIRAGLRSRRSKVEIVVSFDVNNDRYIKWSNGTYQKCIELRKTYAISEKTFYKARPNATKVYVEEDK